MRIARRPWGSSSRPDNRVARLATWSAAARGRHFNGAAADRSAARPLRLRHARSRGLDRDERTWREDLRAARMRLPPRVLLLGAGPDTLPIVDFAARLGWKVTLVDHRPAYAQAARFPSAERVVLTRPDEFLNHVDTRGFNAAVVMSHHLPSDLALSAGAVANGNSVCRIARAGSFAAKSC